MNQLFSERNLIGILEQGILKEDETQYSIVFSSAQMLEDDTNFKQTYINLN